MRLMMRLRRGSTVSIADMHQQQRSSPHFPCQEGNAWPTTRNQSRLSDTRSKSNTDLEPDHDQNANLYRHGCGGTFVRATSVGTVGLERDFNTLQRLTLSRADYR